MTGLCRASGPRGFVLAALLGSCFGLACNTSPEATLETYGDGAAEDYECILGDLGCDCAVGDKCDGFLTCQQGTCLCITPECKENPPTTGPSDTGETAGDGDGDGDTATTGDGDGDGDGDSATGDGDGDTGDGDGDGDSATGDGDGDSATGDGDGDGDTATGDGDGDGSP
jgi:hypothetical protein